MEERANAVVATGYIFSRAVERYQFLRAAHGTGLPPVDCSQRQILTVLHRGDTEFLVMCAEWMGCSFNEVQARHQAYFNGPHQQ